MNEFSVFLYYFGAMLGCIPLMKYGYKFMFNHKAVEGKLLGFMIFFIAIFITLSLVIKLTTIGTFGK